MTKNETLSVSVLRDPDGNIRRVMIPGYIVRKITKDFSFEEFILNNDEIPQYNEDEK